MENVECKEGAPDSRLGFSDSDLALFSPVKRGSFCGLLRVSVCRPCNRDRKPFVTI